MIHDDLRAAIRAERLHPIRWGKPRGLTHRELAEKTRLSENWVRVLEEGHRGSASANTLGVICFTLNIRPAWLVKRGYDDVATIVSVCEQDAPK